MKNDSTKMDMNQEQGRSDSNSQEASDLSFEACQRCLVNLILCAEQLVFKRHREVAETQFSIYIKIQSLKKKCFSI